MCQHLYIYRVLFSRSRSLRSYKRTHFLLVACAVCTVVYRAVCCCVVALFSVLCVRVCVCAFYILLYIFPFVTVRFGGGVMCRLPASLAYCETLIFLHPALIPYEHTHTHVSTGITQPDKHTHKHTSHINTPAVRFQTRICSHRELSTAHTGSARSLTHTIPHMRCGCTRSLALTRTLALPFSLFSRSRSQSGRGPRCRSRTAHTVVFVRNFELSVIFTFTCWLLLAVCCLRCAVCVFFSPVCLQRPPSIFTAIGGYVRGKLQSLLPFVCVCVCAHCA